jgi:hypothetical protein
LHSTAANPGYIALASPSYGSASTALSLGEEALKKGAVVHKHRIFNGIQLIQRLVLRSAMMRSRLPTSWI